MKLPLIVVSTLTLLPALATGERANPGTPAADSNGLHGTYLCEGMRPDGRTYHGTVRIVRHHGAYQIIWNVGNEDQYLGIGILNGDVLAVSYFGGVPGVVAYKVETLDNKARLVGQWTVANAGGQLFGETLTFLTQDVKPLQLPEAARPQPQRPRPSALGRPA